MACLSGKGYSNNEVGHILNITEGMCIRKVMEEAGEGLLATGLTRFAVSSSSREPLRALHCNAV